MLLLLLLVLDATAHQTHEDVRCKCVCPNPSVVNASHTQRKLYIKNVPPTLCDCPNVVITSLYETMSLDPQHAVQLPEAFCPRCVCRYEQRNTGVIRFVVIMVMVVIGVLAIYLVYLVLEPKWARRRQNTYQEHTEEEMSLQAYDSCVLQEGQESADSNPTLPDVAVMTSRSRRSEPTRGPAILNRVTNQSDKWKQQVEVQRRNIYQDRTMLN